MTDKVFAFTNQKGGVGKTTSCVNLAASLAAQNESVLLIDLDPQGNATMGSGVDKGQLTYSMTDLLLSEATAQEVVVSQTPAGYALLPANSDLTAAEAALTKEPEGAARLKKALSSIQSNYDWVIMDCPPALNMLTVNALTAADAVVITMQCEYYALEGLTDLLNTVGQLKQSVNPALHVGGILRTMFDARNRLALEVSQQLISHFNEKVFQTVIPRNVRLAEAPSHGLPVHLYDRGSRGAAAYMALAAEWLIRFPKQKAAAQSAVASTQPA